MLELLAALRFAEETLPDGLRGLELLVEDLTTRTSSKNLWRTL